MAFLFNQRLNLIFVELFLFLLILTILRVQCVSIITSKNEIRTVISKNEFITLNNNKEIISNEYEKIKEKHLKLPKKISTKSSPSFFQKNNIKYLNESNTLNNDCMFIESFRQNVEYNVLENIVEQNCTEKYERYFNKQYRNYQDIRNNNNITYSLHDLKQILNDDSDIRVRSMIGLNSKINSNDNLKREIRAVRKNICEIGCKCLKKNAFLIVTCDFVQNISIDPVFGSKFKIPQKTKSFIAKLNHDTRFRLDEGLFDNNAINSIRIEGTLNGNEQVEISRNSLTGNNGPYPEITIVNVESVILRSFSFSGEFRLSLDTSSFVKIYENAFHNTSFEGQFTNIEDLNFDVGAFNKAQAKISINDSKIDLLSRFEASIREIKFDNCTIGTIDTGAFDVNNINSIIFYRCKIDVFRTKAITEKLFSQNFSITNADIRIIESGAISGSGITELVLKNSNIDEIQSNAIYVYAANATISNNRINKLGNEWLRIKDFTYIHINQNQFGDFGSMLLEKSTISPSVPVFCKFENNSITSPKPGSLNIPNNNCIIREISFYRLCSCNTTWLEHITKRDLKSLSYCRVDDNLKFCLKRPVYNVLAWISEICNYESSNIDCMKGLKQKDVNSKFIDPNENNDFGNYWIYIGLSIIFLVILFVFLIIVTIFKKKYQHQEQTVLTQSSQNNLRLPNTNQNATRSIQQQLFSQEECNIIKQTVNNLKDRYQHEIYDEIQKNTDILMRGHITEVQRVKAIGDIVQALDDCDNVGDDFVAFTDILYKHLASSSGSMSPLEPTYSEPILKHDGLRSSDTKTVIKRETDPYASTSMMPPVKDIQSNIDHIYAEPTSAQQPLLTNEYASPAHRNDVNVIYLYSEPILNEIEHEIIPPYAVVNKRQNIQQSSNNNIKELSVSSLSPTKCYHLPDILHPSTSSSFYPHINNNYNNNTILDESSFKPLKNVHKMVKSFSNDSNLHIRKSPTSNLQIPKYTVPKRRQPSENLLSKRNENPANSLNSSKRNKGGDVISYSSLGILNLSPYGENSMEKGSSDNQSNHSGGSDITVQIDEIIEYVDA